MSHPTIRRARQGDADPIGVLWMRLLQDHAAMEPRFGIADDALERWKNDFSHWVYDAQYSIFVAEQEGRIIGFVTASLWKPVPIYAQVEEVYLNELYVVEKERGQGLGRRLVEAVKAWAETLGVARLRIGVMAANAEGRAFWERLEAQPFMQTLTMELSQKPEGRQEIKKKRRLGF